jgi:glycosyltransferase involved in cell wall biosynthesis
MRVTIDGSGRDIGQWMTALRRESRDEDIRAFHSGRMVRIFGSSWLDFAIRGTDVFHASARTPGVPRRAKLTATVEDLSFWLMPLLNTPGQTKAAHLFADRILGPAHGLIAVSEAVRQDAIRLLGVAPENITTIYPGVSAEFFDAQPAPRDRPYVLALGGDDPRRNFQAVADAWQALKPDLRRSFDLVVAGSGDESAAPGLMAGAALLVDVPLYAGFARPVAQAMAAGVAVVTSDSSSMPEVGRDAAVMVDPHSVSEIAAVMTRLLESESERAKLARYGRARAEKYRWERCAAESLAFFHRILAK